MSRTADRILKNTTWLYAKMGITMLLSLVTTRLILGALGSEDYGIYAVVGGAIGMLGFLNGAMASATQRFISFAEGEHNEAGKVVIFNVSCTIHMMVAVAALLLFVIASFFFFNGILNIPAHRITAAYFVYGSLVISTLFSVMAVPYEAVLNAHENMRYFSLVSILDYIIKFIIALLCVNYSSDKLILYGILMSVNPIIILIIMRVYCHQKYSECQLNIKRYFDKGTFKEMLSFAKWNLLGSTAGLVGNHGQNIITNMFFGVAVNAAAGICGQVHNMLLVFTNNMQKALNPVIVKSEGEHNRAKMIMWSLRGCKFSYLLLAWITIPFAFEVDYILRLWLKDVPEWTSLFLVVGFCRTQLELITIPLVTAIGAVGDIKKYNLGYSSLLVIALFAVYFANKMGAGPDFRFYFFVFVALIQGVLVLLISNKLLKLKFREFIKYVFLPILLVTFVMIAFSYFPHMFLSEGIIRLIITFVSCWIGMILSLYIFYLSKEEREFCVLEIEKIKNKFLSIKK